MFWVGNLHGNPTAVLDLWAKHDLDHIEFHGL